METITPIIEKKRTEKEMNHHHGAKRIKNQEK